ncbi:CO(2)-response secreted protease-like isoform X2 [Salvia hispanica]|uniref:CO(2)-response secreted protease-like isoform X2 n=1 Tax=Salvia hispanica TaxID=49212 RepID=UPI0020097A2E|nr:CO(2)-response secreted protease-like isoform X2 [Salvia hispanica]
MPCICEQAQNTMASVLQLFYIQFSFAVICCMATKPRPYIVYMGSSSSSSASDDSSHLQLLSSLFPREEGERRFLLNSYNHVLKGFSAMLTETEASVLSGRDEVVSVFPDPVLKLHTTRSWDFLEAADSNSGSSFPYEQKSVDVIIGIIDTGVWPESPSFSDQQIGKIPSRWRGVCMEGSDFKKFNCNRKLIGARFYSNHHSTYKSNETNPTTARGSARDFIGHGTHTASTAGGAPVANANYYGLAWGTARGGLPSARIASYKACTEDGCPGSIILKAIDDAVKDGVDIISISIGLSSIFQSDFLSDTIAIGAFHAQQKGVMVVSSGGNDGPDPYTIVNSAPWIFTVAASTIDRGFQTTVVLGNGESLKGFAINFSPLTLGKKYPLVFGEDIAGNFASASDARNCIPGSLDYTKVAGKIVVCMNDEANVSRRIKKLVVEDAKAKGVIIIDGDEEETSPFDAGTFPFAETGATIGSQILHYINSTKNPSATILSATEMKGLRPAPVVASFSSRGPGGLTENILKPDIMAPGVAILAATVPKIEANYGAPGKKPSAFGIKSGTSMACPHVTGAMAFIKSIHPHWSFSAIKSALITTASTSNNIGKTVSNTSDSPANPHQVGAGEIRPIKALDPGLVIETSITDHLYFLCYKGYKQRTIRSLSGTGNFSCPAGGAAEELISSLNYPTISIGSLSRRDGPRKVKRVATNVGSESNATYVASVDAPAGLVVKVAPSKMVFRQGVEKAAFKLFFDGRRAAKGYNFGHVSWFDGSHLVRIVFAVNVV